MSYRVISGIFFSGLLLVFSACENNIIERSATDYFPIKEGNWWYYANNDLYNPKNINITVESPDIILQRECYPFNVSGEFHYYSKDQKGIKEYILVTQNYGGYDYTILQGFVTRLELPLVQGNQFSDSLVDSLDLADKWIKAYYSINGLVSDYQNNEIYGEVYRIIISKHQYISTQDSTIANEEYVEEYYAPNIGLIKFKNRDGEFTVTDFHIE
ncbi:MAG: hypothetical protein ABIL22_05275 [candidate division WOR-3 bacterium]